MSVAKQHNKIFKDDIMRSAIILSTACAGLKLSSYMPMGIDARTSMFSQRRHRCFLCVGVCRPLTAIQQGPAPTVWQGMLAGKPHTSGPRNTIVYSLSTDEPTCLGSKKFKLSIAISIMFLPMPHYSLFFRKFAHCG